MSQITESNGGLGYNLMKKGGTQDGQREFRPASRKLVESEASLFRNERCIDAIDF